MLFLKRIAIGFLAVILLVTAVSCGNTRITQTENLLIAVKKLDFDSLLTVLSSEDVPDFEKLKKQYEAFPDSKKDTLQRLYDKFHYTVNEITETGEVREVKITVHAPDMKKIRMYAETEKIVSAKSAVSIIDGMLNTGEIEHGYMTEISLTVTERKEDGVYKIPYGEKGNRDFADTLYLAEILRFFSLG